MGYWATLDTDRSSTFHCSECGGVAFWPQATRGENRKIRVCKYPTCPWCGAKMNGTDKESGTA